MEADSMVNNGLFINHINEWDLKGPLSNSTEDEKKTPYKRTHQEAFNSTTNEVQNGASNQTCKLDKLCSLCDKRFTVTVEQQSLPSE